MRNGRKFQEKREKVIAYTSREVQKENRLLTLKLQSQDGARREKKSLPKKIKNPK